jgi:hypothetical protein
MEHWFDSLAKSLGRETSRRGVLKRLGAAVATAFAASVIPHSLQAAGATQSCGGQLTNTATDPLNCGGCGRMCASGGACIAGNCYSVVSGQSAANAAQLPPAVVAWLAANELAMQGPGQQGPTPGCIALSSQTVNGPNVPVSVSGNNVSITAVASGGIGAFTLALCNTSPGPTTPTGATSFFDIREEAGSRFGSLAVTVCPASGTLSWLTPANVWMPVSPPAVATSPNCLTLTVSPSSSPSVNDLTGTRFAVGPSQTSGCVDSLCGGVGCCDGTTCRDGSSPEACGHFGQACVVCPADQICTSDGCRPCSEFCPLGCCNGRVCQPGTTHDACGTGGGICTPCGPQEECVANHCFSCTISCPQGCCAAGVCQPGTDRGNCGTGGGVCNLCGPNQTCVAGACTCLPGFTTCGATCCSPGSSCQGGACVGAGTGCTVLGQACTPTAGDHALYGGTSASGICWTFGASQTGGPTGCCPQDQFVPGPTQVGTTGLCCGAGLRPSPPNMPIGCAPP